MTQELCPCGTPEPYSQCCEPYHLQLRTATTAETLMRSRFSAFARGKIDYLVHTMDPQTRGSFNAKAAQAWCEECEFTRLEVLEHTPDGKRSYVEFKAWFRPRHQPAAPEELHHERSLFRFLDGAWYYREAKTPHHV